MQIFGCMEGNRGDLSFYLEAEIGKEYSIGKDFIFSDKKVFIYIDGTITRLSDKAKQISKSYEPLEEKIAFLFSIDFNLESHICGSFNIFLFEYRNRNLKIIRDTRGTRSLFYAKNKEDFFFSSNQKPILEKIKKLSPNKKKLIEFLNWDYRSNEETFFNEIFRLKPKHYLHFKDRSFCTKEYILSRDFFDEIDSNDIQESFKNFLYKAVSGMADKNKKIGVMMSGGLDSSAIAISLKENNYEDVITYSANFDHVKDSSDIDETIFQKNIHDFTSYKHTSIQMEGKSPIKPIKSFTKILDQPIIFPNIYIFEQIIHKLKNDERKVILDGNDGDNTVSHGFEVIYSYFKKMRLIRYTREIYLYSKFKKSGFIRLLYVFTKEAIKRILKIKIKESSNSILNKNINAKKNKKNIISFFSPHKKKLSLDLHFSANECRNELFRYFGIENFSPFYDEELINFCINMPDKYKFNNGYTRNILRKFISEFLPRDHANRDKSILTAGLLMNFSKSDLSIAKREYSNINNHLLPLLNKHKIYNIIKSLEGKKKINEEEIIDLQIFISANTFLNNYNF